MPTPYWLRSFMTWRRQRPWGTTPFGLASRAAALLILTWIIVWVAAVGVGPHGLCTAGAVVLYVAAGIVGLTLAEFVPWQAEMRSGIDSINLNSRATDLAVVIPLAIILAASLVSLLVRATPLIPLMLAIVGSVAGVTMVALNFRRHSGRSRGDAD